MIRKSIVLLPTLVFAVALWCVPSHAQYYVSGNVGAFQLMDADTTASAPGVSATGGFEFKRGYGVNGAVGLSLGNLRMDGEISYRGADFDQGTLSSITVSGTTFSFSGATGDVSGDVTALALMGNLWYDIDLGGKLKPFIGGGIGAARIDANIDSIAGVPLNVGGDDTVFAYQAGVGVGYEINQNLVATLGYRFFGTDKPKFESQGVTVESEYRTHNIEVGMRFKF